MNNKCPYPLLGGYLLFVYCDLGTKKTFLAHSNLIVIGSTHFLTFGSINVQKPWQELWNWTGLKVGMLRIWCLLAMPMNFGSILMRESC